MDGVDLMLSNACLPAQKMWRITRFLWPGRYDKVVNNLVIAIELSCHVLKDRLSEFRKKELTERLKYACYLYKDLYDRTNYCNSIHGDFRK
jgi:hypothetical protein